MGRSAWGCLLLLLALDACAHIPKRRYGVDGLHVVGMHALDDDSLEACIATEPRKKVTLGVGALRNPQCGSPPFDHKRASVRLFAWPWTKWPVYDEAVLKLDLKRVERWYQARGYYDAHVTGVVFDPKKASESDRPECSPRGCPVSVQITVAEGRPVRIRNVVLQGAERLSKRVQKSLKSELTQRRDDPFDEALYDAMRDGVGRALREAGYARAKVVGEVNIHRGLLWADVTLTVTPGALCKIGEVRVASGQKLPTAPIIAAAKLRKGQLYRESDLDDAQRSVYALGSFSAVTVRGNIEGEGEWVDITLEVEPRRESEILTGVGVLSGVLTTGPAADEWQSVPQWDVHLLSSYEHRNFFGGLRHFRVDDRPRIIFLDAFPGVPSNSPRFGNSFNISFSQPGVIESRTFLVVDARWDYGPDPFLLFFRHDMGVAIGLERGFWRQRVQVRIAAHQEIMEVSERQPIVTENEIPSSYRLPFLEQRFSIDLRDDAARPSKGGYFRIGVHEAVRIWDPSWNYLRITPDLRGYIPIGLGMVVAARTALGALFIANASDQLDPTSRSLGPQTYRLRGGGAQSNRGFLPGRLGDGLNGGIRRWEASLELRVPITESLSLALFGDMGDVHAGKAFRFDHMNTAVGGGIRYYTVIGALRLDVGYRPYALQRADGSTPSTDTTNLGFTHFPGAIHLTIGDPF